jgi:hypothetical protein
MLVINMVSDHFLENIKEIKQIHASVDNGCPHKIIDYIIKNMNFILIKHANNEHGFYDFESELYIIKYTSCEFSSLNKNIILFDYKKEYYNIHY